MATNRITELETRVCKLLLAGRLDSEGRMKYGGWEDFCKEAVNTIPDLARYSPRGLAERLIKDGLVNRHHGKKVRSPSPVSDVPESSEPTEELEANGYSEIGCSPGIVVQNGTTLSDIAKQLAGLQNSMNEISILLRMATGLLCGAQGAQQGEDEGIPQQTDIEFLEGSVTAPKEATHDPA